MDMKHKFTTMPIIYYYHPERKQHIETDTLNLYKVGNLSPYELDWRWHPLSYYNICFLPAKLNYNLHDKEMVVIVN